MGYEFDYEYDWTLLEKKKKMMGSVMRSTRDSNKMSNHNNGPGVPKQDRKEAEFHRIMMDHYAINPSPQNNQNAQ